MKKRIHISIGIVVTLLIIICSFIYLKYLNGIELIQLSPQTDSQMMGYIMKTKNNKIIVIDGGTKGDSDNLSKYLKNFGGKVDYWFLTHPHKDHVGAFENIIKANEIKVDNIYLSINDLDYVTINEPKRLEDAKALYEVLNLESVNSKIKNINVKDVINIDNIKIDVLGIKNPEITINAGNNSSMVLKFSVNDKSILFLADTGIQSGEKLIKNEKEKLKSDYVQMAHHGQSGVNEDVYKAINPKYCLWPTPLWLWNNENNSQDIKIEEVKNWMSKLNIEKNYIAKDGDIKIKIW